MNSIAALDDRAAAVLRAKCLDLGRSRVLVSVIAGSPQEADLSLPPSCEGLARIRQFRSEPVPPFPPNPLPMLPASRWLGRPCRKVERARVFQLAGCAWRCWYCYVPFTMLSGNPNKGRWLDAREMVAMHLAEPNAPGILDLSGGSPDLVPEWIAWTMDAVEEAGACGSTYIWSDDNLSSDLLMRPEMARVLDRIVSFRGYGRAFCLKGYDAASFAFNTGRSGDGLEGQLEVLARYVSVGLSLYGYVTLTGPDPNARQARDAISRLLDHLQRLDESLPGRVVPLRVSRFSAMAGRVDRVRSEALHRQESVAEIWLEQLRIRAVRPIWEDLPD